MKYLQRKNDVPISETLRALKELLKEGKIKYYGLSNETTYGLTRWCHMADSLGIPRPITIQNSFSLLHRSFETELAEACAPRNLNVGLLVWSPLGGGALSGKYMDGNRPPRARFTLYSNFQNRYINKRSTAAIKKYKSISENGKISMTTLALAFCDSRWFTTSTIIGATSLSQLEECIDAFLVKLTPEILQAIDEVHLDCRDPSQTI